MEKKDQFKGKYALSLKNHDVKADCYGKAAMIISDILKIDHRIAETFVATSGTEDSPWIPVDNLRDLQLIKICLNNAGVFIGHNWLDYTSYEIQSEDRRGYYTIESPRNDGLASKAYDEAMIDYIKTYAEKFHIENTDSIRKCFDIDEEDQIDIEQSEQCQYVDPATKARDSIQQSICTELKNLPLEKVETVCRHFYHFFKKQLVMIHLQKLDVDDPMFNNLPIQ